MKSKKKLQQVKTQEKNNIQSFFISYEDSREFIQKLHIKNSTQWYKYCHGQLAHMKKPSNIPTHPHKVYKSQWQGWAQFLGASYQKGECRKNKANFDRIIELKEKDRHKSKFLCRKQILKIAV